MRFLFLLIFLFFQTVHAIGVGEKAPDFTLESLNHGTQSLSDYKGKVVYLFFLGYGCPPCWGHSPAIETQIYEKYSRDDVQVLGLDCWNGGSSGAASFKATVNPTPQFPLLINAGSIQTLYGIPIQDYIVIVDQQGNVAYIHDNYHNDDDISKNQQIIDDLLITTAINEDTKTPYKFDLLDNFPNPFNPTTKIPFTIDKPQHILLQVFNISGHLINTLFDGQFAAGNYQGFWDGRDKKGNHVSSGIYFYRLQGESTSVVKQMILLK